MGGTAYSVVDFHVLHHIQMGWIPLSNILQVSETGTYQVNSAEIQTTAVQAIQIAIPGSANNLYISYRQPAGEDASLSSAFVGGASIHFWKGSNNKTQLATNYPWNGALSDGQTYTSPEGTSIKQISHNGTNVTLDIDIRRVPPFGHR
jgi:hypothetical protein